MAISLSLQNLNTLVQGMAAAVQGASAKLLDLTAGSVLRAILEANAGVALWVQWLLVLLMQRQRLATSVGTDVDSWVGDFSLTRLPAVAASGAVTFSRFYPQTAATIPVGAVVQSTDGSQTFAVTADATNPLYSAPAGGYVVPVNTATATVPVVAQNGGVQGNVAAGAITLLSQAIPGIDTVSNSLALANGVDPESDDSLKSRFPVYIAGLSKATLAAIQSAISSVQQGISYAVAANVDEAGSNKPGHFVITVDDGTGAPSTDLKSAVYAAVDQVRSLCETFSVQSPSITNVTVSLTISAAPGFSKSNLQGPVASAVTAYIDAMPIGSPLYYTRIAQVAWDAAPGIASVTALLVNGGTSDISATPSTVIKAASVSVN
jgi:uncharacterized phage protein gp47/JayE